MGTQKICTDLTGQKFGKLRVIKRAENYVSPKGNVCSQWLCECECGNTKVIQRGDLVQGKVVSCGCYNFYCHKKHNPFEICGDYVTMYTLKGEPFYVDLEDFDKVKDICWSKNKRGYIRGSCNKKIVYLHRLIMDAHPNMSIDHKDHNESNNRKSNLREVTTSQNGMNRQLATNNKTGVTGIFWYDKSAKWRVMIQINNHPIFLGDYNNFEDAVKARKQAEEKYFGEWSYDNSQRV